MVSGKFLFNLKTTHGFPLDFALDEIINVKGGAIDWPEFIEESRKNGFWDFQTHDLILYALQDASIDKDKINEIMARVKMYMLKNEHPAMVDLNEKI